MTAAGAGLRSVDLRAGLGWNDALALVPIEGRGRDADRRAGMAAASAALRSLRAVPAGVLGHGDDGRPLWPEGFVGSISHGGACAVAAVAPRSSVVAAGIDIEVAGDLSLADASLVLSPAELDAAPGHGGPSLDPTLIWSAKEAAFKCWSHLTEGGLPPVDPLDIAIEVSLDVGHTTPAAGDLTASGEVGALAVRGLGAVLGDRAALAGRWVCARGVVVTLFVVPAE